MSTKLISVGLFFLFIFLSGFWLSRLGKPYSMVFILMHKLIGLATGIYLIITVYQIIQVASLSKVEIITSVFTILFFIGLVATGGLISAEKPVPVIAYRIHKLFPYLTVLSSVVTIYLLAYGRQLF